MYGARARSRWPLVQRGPGPSPPRRQREFASDCLLPRKNPPSNRRVACPGRQGQKPRSACPLFGRTVTWDVLPQFLKLSQATWIDENFFVLSFRPGSTTSQITVPHQTGHPHLPSAPRCLCRLAITADVWYKVSPTFQAGHLIALIFYLVFYWMRHRFGQALCLHFVFGQPSTTSHPHAQNGFYWTRHRFGQALCLHCVFDPPVHRVPSAPRSHSLQSPLLIGTCPQRPTRLSWSALYYSRYRRTNRFTIQ